MPPQIKKSPFWAHFQKKTEKIASCNLCGATVKLGGGTSNLKGHLDRKHPRWNNKKSDAQNKAPNLSDVFEVGDSDLDSVTSIAFSSQPSIVKSFDKQNQFKNGGSKEILLNNALIYMICKDNLPFNCTEKAGMQKFLKMAVPQYKPPSRTTVTRLIEAKYDSLQIIIREALKNIPALALTTDIATIMNATRSFIVLTGHYVDEKKSSIRSVVFGAKQLTPYHTGSHICADLTEMLSYFQVEADKVVSVTTDNGANIVAAAKQLFPSKGSSVHVSCYAHNINLVVSKALGAVPELVKIIEKVKQIVGYFKHSNVAQDQLREEQAKEGKTDGTFLYLIQEVSTRWNSTLHCLQRFKEMSGHVAKILADARHKNAPPMISSYELGIIGECIQLLLPLEKATNDISGTRYATASLVIPYTNCLNLSLDRIRASFSVTIKLKEELLKQVESRLFPLENNSLLAAATVLDPRFKKAHFRSPINCANSINFIKTQIGQKAVNSVTTSPVSLQPDVSADFSLWDIHEEYVSQSNIPIQNNASTLPNELIFYLSQPLSPRHQDPIKYWIENRNAIPTIYPIAIKFLTVCAASVASERVVSTLNNVCTDNRSRLTPEHVNNLVFLGSLDDEFWAI